MPAELLQQAGYTLTLSGEERDRLLDLLREALGEARVEAHRTHTPGFRDQVLGQQAVLRSLITKLAGLRPGAAGSVAMSPRGIEEAAAVTEALFLDEQGRFQMTTEELEDFLRFLRENKVRVEAEAAAAFHSGGQAYRYGRLLHPFDADSVKSLYRTWREAQGSGAAG